MKKMEDIVNDIDVNMVNAILSELDNANNHNVYKIVHEINNVWKKVKTPKSLWFF